MSSLTDRLYSAWMRQNGRTGTGARLKGGMGAVAPMTNRRPEIIDMDKPRGGALADNEPDSRTDKQASDYVDNIKKVD